MTSRSRYTLIATGIVAFIILTPFFYIFVRGLKYDSTNQRFVKTGTLSVKTNPTGAVVYLNGKEEAKTNTNIRFLVPGDYDVQITKEDYFAWSKRLNIREQYVTWANIDLPEITLFLAEPVKHVLAKDVSNFFAGKNRIIALKTEQLLVAEISSEEFTTITLPKEFLGSEITSSKDEDYFLISNSDFTGIFDAKTNLFSDITNLVAQQAAYTSTNQFQASENILKLSNDNKLYQLKDGTVYKIDWRDNKKEILIDSVLAFQPHAAGIYYISIVQDEKGIQRHLMRAQNSGDQPTKLIENLPSFRTADLALSDKNQLFILGDGSLYDLSNNINKIADYVQKISIDNENEKMLYATQNEINIYDLNTTAKHLITRSSQPIKNPIALHELGWVFFDSDNRLQNIEMDNRDHQNNYTFAPTSENSKFFLQNKAKELYLLNQGDLIKMKLR